MTNKAHKKPHRKRSSKRHERSLLREFSLEIFIGILFLFGAFLLYEDMEIKSAVFQGLISFRQGVSSIFSGLVKSFVDTVDAFESSDIVGTILILMSFVLLAHRARQKALIRYGELAVCPECGDDLTQVHRNTLQKLTGRIFRLKIRRYNCKSCDYDGLRIRRLGSR
ncbi:MAG: hypothetical protein L3J79_01680 [Candidatus Marinimicrobia bacterium]|nr:hypothetical protein [Candidatus Neomarinimicrobiota bacterium]